MGWKRSGEGQTRDAAARARESSSSVVRAAVLGGWADLPSAHCPTGDPLIRRLATIGPRLISLIPDRPLLCEVVLWASGFGLWSFPPARPAPRGADRDRDKRVAIRGSADPLVHDPRARCSRPQRVRHLWPICISHFSLATGPSIGILTRPPCPPPYPPPWPARGRPRGSTRRRGRGARAWGRTGCGS